MGDDALSREDENSAPPPGVDSRVCDRAQGTLLK